MKIEKIIIENFKSFKGQFELSLEEGINILVGDNEAGKSTIIEALHLALSGYIHGRYFKTEFNQYLFNNEKVEEYLDSLESEAPLAPPKILIEVYLGKEDVPLFMGNLNTEKTNNCGFSFHIEFDDKYKEEYELILKDKTIKTLPLEYYHFYWETFAREVKTPRLIPIKSALIDSSSSKQSNGSDIYISRIVKDFLEKKELVSVSQAYRNMKESFMEDSSIKAINEKVKTASNISDKDVKLSVELSAVNAWESSLMTYLDNIPFHHIGKGEQCIIKTKLALSHKKNEEVNVILLEEPENHLSHTKLNQLIRDIDKYGTDKQLLISTHSSFVANKLGLDRLILLSNQKIARLTDLSEDTKDFFLKLSGYDTLRLILCKKAILVEGDSDELILQKGYKDKNGRLPIEDGIDVISVGISFLRFLELAEKLDKKVAVVTDSDGDLAAIEKKYSNYLGENLKENIQICYDTEVDSGDLKIGEKSFNYNTLEPKLVKANTEELVNEILGTSYSNLDELHKYMKSNKTHCALRFFNTEKEFEIPNYIEASYD